MFFQLRMIQIILIFKFFIFSSLFAQTNNDINGRWVTIDGDIIREFRFDNGNFEARSNGSLIRRGTYIITNGIINFCETHIYADSLYSILSIFRSPSLNLDSRWYTINEANVIFRSILMELGFSESEAELHSMFTSNYSYQYFIDGNTLILVDIEDDGQEIRIFSRE